LNSPTSGDRETFVAQELPAFNRVNFLAPNANRSLPNVGTITARTLLGSSSSGRK
jgi:hypothetical protein